MDRADGSIVMPGGAAASGGRRDPVRRVVLAALALYLAPAALVVLLVGGVGLGCCALLRLAGAGPRRSAPGRPRRDRGRLAVGRPHAAARRDMRSLSR